ncbi:MAG: biopolymer transporter ExbD, partial [Planctomycetes bacterium]|nr:biopolymer transporter ExbD [Planctomycetota bacterium]
IFFIVTTVFVEETGVDVDRPQAASAVQLEKNSILIALTERGDVVYGKSDIGLAGVQSVVKRMLATDSTLPVIIQADEKAASGKLVQIVDQARLAGARKVSVASRNPGS